MKEVFQEESGKVSFTRIIATCLVIFYIVVASYLAFVKQELIDMPIGLGGLIVLLYGINKTGSVAKDIFQSKISP